MYLTQNLQPNKTFSNTFAIVKDGEVNIPIIFESS